MEIFGFSMDLLSFGAGLAGLGRLAGWPRLRQTLVLLVLLFFAVFESFIEILGFSMDLPSFGAGLDGLGRLAGWPILHQISSLSGFIAFAWFSKGF